MPRFLLVCLAAALAVPCGAQVAPGPMREGDVRLTASVVGVGYEESGRTPSQVAVPVALEAVLPNGIGLGVQTSYASASGFGASDLSGLGDTQLAVSKRFRAGAVSATAGLGLNVPTGQRALVSGEAETAYLAGQSFYDFPLPTWGQGFNAAPSVTLAVPVGERLAVGIGGGWHYRGAFQPLSDNAAEFDPSDEFLVTVGADARLGETGVASADVVYVEYGRDTFGERSYDAGRALGATVEVGRQWGGVDLLGSGHVLTRGDRAPVAVFAAPESVSPLQARVRAEARTRLFRGATAGMMVQGRTYEASEAFAATSMVDLVVTSEVAVGRGLVVRPHAGLTLGDLPGRRVGLRVSYVL